MYSKSENIMRFDIIHKIGMSFIHIPIIVYAYSIYVYTFGDITI